jgi:hypothetical protein
MVSHRVEGPQRCASSTQGGRAVAHPVADRQQASTGSFLARRRTRSPGHFRSSELREDHLANDRFQSTAAIGSTAARRCSFSKAVAHDLAALVGTRCRPYVRSSISRTGAADPLCEFNSGSTGVSDVTQTGLSLDGSLWQNTGRLRAFATGRFPTDDPRRPSRCRYLERRSIATGDALQARARSPA